ncbi:alpha/beta fold hydrolase [Arthrobacter sp. YN]|uniref:alpha/beta fold hydrolase n=1 Tax=Arthrobacter sp. YN TaxID=2020486 RepID=UPI000B614FE1|nr:alpha/beta hydrolase [Arthrobacter sp. YN]ASN20077.1 hypothetical protein CGK93_10645 [Arthrobacter sp. YN]
MSEATSIESGYVVSGDGTRIGFRKLGAGPSMVLVHGSLADGEEYLPLASALSNDFTVWVADSRGRGLTGDFPADYGRQTIIEDHQALMEEAGGNAVLFGHSFGATSVLLSAATMRGLAGVIAYEPPLPPNGMLTQEIEVYQAAIDAGDIDGAVSYAFTNIVGGTAEDVEFVKTTPVWEAMKAIAPSFVPELRLLDALPDMQDEVEKIHVPLLAIRGGLSPENLRQSTAVVVEAASSGVLLEMANIDHSGHLSDPAGMAQHVVDWFHTAASS